MEFDGPEKVNSNGTVISIQFLLLPLLLNKKEIGP
jgi:hypothetical protein